MSRQHKKGSSAVVYDVPVNLLLARDMKLVSETALSETYAAGKILRGEEAAANSLTTTMSIVSRLSWSTTVCGRKVYVHDICELFWDTASGGVVATVRGFRPVAEVLNVGQAEMRGRLVRVWEDCTAGAETQGSWSKRRGSEEDSTQKYKVTHAPWCKEGTSEDPMFVVRREGFHLNNDNLVFFSAPVACYNDAFNCFGMGNKVFVRGGLLLWVGDGPGRAKVLGSKACNNFSGFPCPYCMVEQRDNISGGDLGDAQYGVEANRRIWDQITAGFDTLKSLADNPVEQSRQSMVLGLVKDSNGPSPPMYDSMLTAPTAVVPVERLHFDALGSCQLCQVSCLEMLTQGRRLVSVVVVQNPSLLYPAGTERLKDIVSNYSSLTGSN
ncbi:unnamed protein product [Ectocarpus sp. CCAP 1310/34]|nr:unnamed protein product [Ectocarpus sp. CCAP 1310/34]